MLVPGLQSCPELGFIVRNWCRPPPALAQIGVPDRLVRRPLWCSSCNRGMFEQTPGDIRINWPAEVSPARRFRERRNPGLDPISWPARLDLAILMPLSWDANSCLGTGWRQERSVMWSQRFDRLATVI